MGELEDHLLDTVEPERIYWDNSVSNIPVRDLDLSMRAKRALQKLNAGTLGEVSKLTEDELFSIRGFGVRSLKDINEELLTHGLPRIGESVSCKARVYQRIKEAIDSGAKTRYEIADRSGLSYSYISNVIRNNEGLYLRLERKNKKRDDCFKRFAKCGLSQVQLANRFEISYTRVQQLLKETGVYESWKESRPHYASAQEKHKMILEDIAGMINNVAGGLVSIIQEAAYRNSGEEQWAEKKAFEYLRKHPRSKLGLEKITALFSLYIDAEKNGNRISLSEFSELAQIPVMTISKIFNKSSLEPMVRGRLERHPINKEKKDALRRIAESGTKLSSRDISYFLGIPDYVANQDIRIYGCEFSGGLRKDIGLRCGLRRKHITYALASQIYEAIDLGFDVEETAELNDTTNKIIIYALSDRAVISRDIRRELRILYPGRKSNKSYLSSEENKDNKQH